VTAHWSDAVAKLGATSTARRFAEGAATHTELQSARAASYAAASYASYTAAAAAERRAQADIIRKYFPNPPRLR
jgi:hypothetical protein